MIAISRVVDPRPGIATIEEVENTAPFFGSSAKRAQHTAERHEEEGHQTFWSFHPRWGWLEWHRGTSKNLLPHVADFFPAQSSGKLVSRSE